jgi:hypothetical protein
LIVDSKIFEMAERRVAGAKTPNHKNSRSLFFDDVNGSDLTYNKFAELMLTAYMMRPQKFRFAKTNSNDDYTTNFLLWVVFDVDPIKQERSSIEIDTFEVFYPVKFADRFRDVTGVKLDFFEIKFGCLELTYASKHLNADVIELFQEQANFENFCDSYSIKIIKYNESFLRRKI